MKSWCDNTKIACCAPLRNHAGSITGFYTQKIPHKKGILGFKNRCKCIKRVHIFIHYSKSTWNINIFSLLCIRKCLVKIPFSENLLSHCLQENGFSPVCILICLFKLLFSENFFSHCWQENGFSSVCILICLFKLLFVENLLSHC